MNNTDRNAAIIALRKDGIGPREIARRMRVSNGVVADVLDRAGMAKPGGHGGNNRIDDVVMASALTDIEHGMSERAAAKRWGVGRSTIGRHRREAKIKAERLKQWAAGAVERTFTPEKCDALMGKMMFGSEPRAFEGLKPTKEHK